MTLREDWSCMRRFGDFCRSTVVWIYRRSIRVILALSGKKNHRLSLSQDTNQNAIQDTPYCPPFCLSVAPRADLSRPCFKESAGHAMKHLPEGVTFPEADVFLTWARRSISDLGMHPSNFLRDEDVPGSINRLNRILAKPNTLRFGLARRLHQEIVTEAKSKGVDLLPLHMDVLEPAVKK